MADLALELEGYVVTDAFFGAPYLDVDEWRELAEGGVRYRFLHGGFAGTDTRFAFYYPTQDVYRGRLLQPLEGAYAGHETAFGEGTMGLILGGLAPGFRFGAFVVESNMGHIGATLCPKAGTDVTIYGYRAAAESARLAKHLAEQLYGAPPRHSYVYGGSGGARRSPLCLEHTDVWDGALPFMGGGVMGDEVFEQPEADQLLVGSQTAAFAAMFNVQRLLRGEKLQRVIDATEPGGSGDPFAGLTIHEREELANLYRLGFPRGAEIMIAHPMGQIGLWAWSADWLYEQDAAYYDAFWTRPGFLGHDAPGLFGDDLVDVRTTVTRVITAGEAAAQGGVAAVVAGFMAARFGPDFPLAFEAAPLGGYLLGSSLRMLTGQAAGRQLYCVGTQAGALNVDGFGEPGELKLTGVAVGDQVHIDNRRFLANCYYYRHQTMHWDADSMALAVDGAPIYPQRRHQVSTPPFGGPYTGRFAGKMLYIQHTHDTSLWPNQLVLYDALVRRVQGAEADDRFRVQFLENAEHIPPQFIPLPGAAASTRFVDFTHVVEQGLHDLAAWVEEGVAPPATRYRYEHGRLLLPADADERGGIQPVVRATVGGGVRADVVVGQEVVLEVATQLPAGVGVITRVAWDLDGSGQFATPAGDLTEDGSGRTSVQLATKHAFAEPGTFFPSVRVSAHRQGDTAATTRRIDNLARVRVVVSPISQEDSA